MPDFRFVALDGKGGLIDGIEHAANRMAALRSIEARALLPVRLDESMTSREQHGPKGPRLSASQLTAFTEELALLLAAHIMLDRALAILSASGTTGPVAVVDLLRASIANGRSLSEAMAEQPATFPRSYVETIAAAERSGRLEQALQLLVRERKRLEELRAKLLAALAYPLILGFAAFALLIFVLIVVVPQFRMTLSEAQLETASQVAIVFKMSAFLLEHFDLLVGISIVVLTALAVACQSESVRSAIPYHLFRLPGLARVAQYQRTVVVAALLALLLRSGVDLSSTLKHIREALGAERAGHAMAGVIQEVRSGRRLADALGNTTIIAVPAVHMLKVGEESGDIAGAADRIAVIYQERLERSLQRATAIASPVLLFFASGLIGWVVLSIVSALLSFNELAL